MGSFIDWFSRSYKGIIIALTAIMAIMLVVLATQHVNASKPAAGAEPGPIPTFSSAPVQAPPRAVFFGDSYVEGYGASTPAQRWTTLVAEEEGWTEVNLGQGGTGYLNGGPEEGQDDQYGSRIDKIKAANPDIVIVFGSQNDLKFPSSQVAPAIKSTAQRLKSAVPDAQLILIGPLNPGVIAESTRTNDTAVREAAAAVGADYISMLDGGSPLSSDRDYFTDGQHPSDAGYAKIAARVEEALPADITR